MGIIQILSLGALLMLLAFSTIAQAEDDLPVSIELRRSNDQSEVKVVKGTTIISLHSPAGIGRAIVDRKQAKWPESMVLHLHLKGLENFQISSGKLTLHAAVGSDPQRQVRQWKNGNEQMPLTGQSPFWMPLRRIAPKPNADANGYFEIRLPAPLLAENPQSITIEWIDFYRN